MLRPTNGKNLEEPKNEKYTHKTYTFVVTKCDETSDLLVTDGIIILPKGQKMSPLEQRKKGIL
jgi:hypothetical protein